MYSKLWEYLDRIYAEVSTRQLNLVWVVEVSLSPKSLLIEIFIHLPLLVLLLFLIPDSFLLKSFALFCMYIQVY